MCTAMHFLLYIHPGGDLKTGDRKVFSRISSENQKIVHEVMGRVFLEMDRKNREDNEKALEVLLKQGIKFITPPSEMMSDLVAVASAVSTRLVDEGGLSKEILYTLDRHLKEFRSQRQNAP